MVDQIIGQIIGQNVEVTVNHFLIKNLLTESYKVYQYRCTFDQPLEPGEKFKRLGSIAYKLGTIGIRFGDHIISRSEIQPQYLDRDDWHLAPLGELWLDPQNDNQRLVMEQLERRSLRENLEKEYSENCEIERYQGAILCWIKGERGREKWGEGWEVQQGMVLDVSIDRNGQLFLEIDSHYKFYCPFTLHDWLEKYPECHIDMVRNTYPDKKRDYRTWRYIRTIDISPNALILTNSHQTLADYHRSINASEEEITDSYVIEVKSNNFQNKFPDKIYHLSKRVRPILTMDTLAQLGQFTGDQSVKEVFGNIRLSIQERLTRGVKSAIKIAQRIYRIENPIQPQNISGKILPAAQLYGKKGKLNRTAEVQEKGYIKVGETNFGCLNLNRHGDDLDYPPEIKNLLLKIARNSDTTITLEPPRTRRDLPQTELQQQSFWQAWADADIKTVLVILPHGAPEKKDDLRIAALKAGITTQFMRPMVKPDNYRAVNVVLGLLAKAAWQPVGMTPIDHPQAADLVIGFDTGTNRDLYYGTSAFAVLADGQGLGWELPNVQRGEKFSEAAIWSTVSRLVLRFQKICQRLPQRVLLMRDGFVQDDEFPLVIEKLKAEGIAVDVIGVRKSGAGRMAKRIANSTGQGFEYKNPQRGTVILMPEEKSFLLVSADPKIGSPRPLKIVHEFGNTPLEILALQTYHMTELHPASGYSYGARLPWVLHLADRSSKEFQRVKDINVFHSLDRYKLFSV